MTVTKFRAGQVKKDKTLQYKHKVFAIQEKFPEEIISLISPVKSVGLLMMVLLLIMVLWKFNSDHDGSHYQHSWFYKQQIVHGWHTWNDTAGFFFWHLWNCSQYVMPTGPWNVLINFRVVCCLMPSKTVFNQNNSCLDFFLNAMCLGLSYIFKCNSNLDDPETMGV